MVSRPNDRWSGSIGSQARRPRYPSRVTETNAQPDSRPESTRSIDGLAAAMAEHDYVSDRALATVVFLGLELGRPILLEGEAGVGKTEVAKVLRERPRQPAHPAPVLRGPRRHDRGLRVELPPPDAGDPAARGARRGQPGATAHDIFGPDFLIKRPLLQALESTDGAPPVLLIDEIDRADEEFEAYLLEILSDFQVTVPEIGTIRAAQPPRVILTSNRTREVHDALKRRCLYHWIDYPTVEKEYAIVQARLPGMDARLARQVVGFVQRLRQVGADQAAGCRGDARLGGRAHGARARRACRRRSSTRRSACCSSTRRTCAPCGASGRRRTSRRSRPVDRADRSPSRLGPAAVISGPAFLAQRPRLRPGAQARRA